MIKHRGIGIVTHTVILVLVSLLMGSSNASALMPDAIDTFPSTGEITFIADPGVLPHFPDGMIEKICLSSRGLPDAIVKRQAQVGNTIETEIIALQLTGMSQALGPVNVRVGSALGLPPTLGEIRKVKLDKNGDFKSGTSFFDVFFEIELSNLPDPQTGMPPLRLKNSEALRLTAHPKHIHSLPPNSPGTKGPITDYLEAAKKKFALVPGISIKDTLHTPFGRPCG